MAPCGGYCHVCMRMVDPGNRSQYFLTRQILTVVCFCGKECVCMCVCVSEWGLRRLVFCVQWVRVTGGCACMCAWGGVWCSFSCSVSVRVCVIRWGVYAPMCVCVCGEVQGSFRRASRYVACETRLERAGRWVDCAGPADQGDPRIFGCTSRLFARCPQPCHVPLSLTFPDEWIKRVGSFSVFWGWGRFWEHHMMRTGSVVFASDAEARMPPPPQWIQGKDGQGQVR